MYSKYMPISRNNRNNRKNSKKRKHKRKYRNSSARYTGLCNAVTNNTGEFDWPHY